MFKRLVLVRRVLEDPQIRANLVESFQIMRRHAAAAGNDLLNVWWTAPNHRSEKPHTPEQREVLGPKETAPSS